MLEDSMEDAGRFWKLPWNMLLKMLEDAMEDVIEDAGRCHLRCWKMLEDAGLTMPKQTQEMQEESPQGLMDALGHSLNLNDWVL